MMHMSTLKTVRVADGLPFLMEFATEILELNGNADDFMGLELLSDSVHILRFLAKLNYLLIHERVVPSISFCLSCRGGRLTLGHRLFLVVVVDTTGNSRAEPSVSFGLGSVDDICWR
jgi:hypothetical protein